MTMANAPRWDRTGGFIGDLGEGSRKISENQKSWRDRDDLGPLVLAVWVMEWYIISGGRGMILSFREGWLREFFVNDVRSKKIPSDLEERLFRKIQMIDDATTDRDLRSPPSNHFEKLRGHLDGLHSIRVNKRWRLVFRWNSGRGEAEDVYLDDHSYD
jgi:proteic killer suppression protein